MISESAHPSRTSVDSTTALASSYRPPQKDYAAAFAALQNTYGAPGMGQRSPREAVVMNVGVVPGSPSAGTKKTPASSTKITPVIQPGNTSTAPRSSASQTGAKAKAKGILKAIEWAWKKIMGTTEPK
ncbi:hypothetical protein DFH07DRAFT_951429 [Mycena maculata]|uniref:Uncharacterized protein n=1 Tax=Mycena maculata TaxID=230809 RepID=A0AAD7NVF2_9AGAR|nr:hypothetical protein DFH07DRAFT_951429 [Mycena maculata]